MTTAAETTDDPVREKIDFSMMYVTHAALRRDVGRLIAAATVGNAGPAFKRRASSATSWQPGSFRPPSKAISPGSRRCSRTTCS